MSHWRITVTLAALALALPLVAAATPAGKVVIAQGVDPSTLDTMNQQETPASNVAAQIFDMLVERDANLKLVPAWPPSCPSSWRRRCGR